MHYPCYLFVSLHFDQKQGSFALHSLDTFK